MPIVETAPTGAPLVVRFNTTWLRIRFAVPAGFTIFLGLLGLVAGASLLPYSVGAGLTASLLSAGLITLGVLVIARLRHHRAAVVLAADADGAWLALSPPGRNARIAHLPWSEVIRVRPESWAMPNGRHAPFICFEAPAVAREVASDPVVAASTANAVARYGTPFVISDRGKDTDLFTILRRLAPLARGAGVPVDPFLPG